MNECVCLSECLALTKPRPLAEWHEDMGDVLWWCWEEGSECPGHWLGEAPYVGSPNSLGFEVAVRTQSGIFTFHGEAAPPIDTTHRIHVGGWPGYHTHFTPLPPMPSAPVPIERKFTGPGHLEQTGYIEVPK